MKSGNSAGKIKKRPVWQTVLMWVFFPVGLFDLMLRTVSRRYRTDITTKTTVIGTAVFGVLMAAYALAVILIVALAPEVSATTRVRVIVVAVLLALGFSAIFAAASTLTARTMLSPLKGMIKRIDEITVEDMSARLDPVGTQDELNELSSRINRMLNGLQEAFERQSNFISDASHELRTPISVIRGYSDLLDRWGKTDESVLAEAIEAIRSEADNMRSIVEQLLYLAKLGSFKLHPTVFDISAVVSEIVDAYALTRADRKVTFTSRGTVTVLADKGLTVELVRVITDNAIKYTSDGGRVDVSVERMKGGASVTVADDGIGISEDDLPHIFDRFYRCDKARVRSEGSTGLGLSIAKSIAEMMGGSITAKSVLGKGSVFTVFLPLLPPPAVGAGGDKEGASRG